MMNVRKRSGKVVPFDAGFISRAVSLAAAAAGEHSEEGIERITAAVTEKLRARKEEIWDIETIQDTVEETLFEQKYYQTAKAYIRYRLEKEKERAGGVEKEGLLTREFLSPYKHAPSPMEQLGAFVYTRTYSRFLPRLGRREFWWETVRRAVEYNCSLAPTSREEAERLYDNIYHLRQFLSGRTLWVGGTPVADQYPMANYNCAFTVIDSFSAYHDLFYLLMVGSGVGVRVLKQDAEKLPPVRTDLRILHKSYDPKPAGERLEYTNLTFSRDVATLTIGDSKEGWAQAIAHYFDLLTSREYRGIDCLVVEYDSIRPKGERLKTFGGTASGYGSMMTMIDKIHKVVAAAGSREGEKWVSLKPIDLLDIANIIGENVVSGGVRRTSEIGLIDADDETCIQAKSHLYRQVNGRWEIDKNIAHRQMSNNSIYYRHKPTREKLHWHLQQMRYSGEPGWINEEAGEKRRPNFSGCNPCGEILLDSHGLCNLTTLNVMGFVKDGALDTKALLEAQRLSARAGYRMTCRELEMYSWNAVLSDRLAGYGERREDDEGGADQPSGAASRDRAPGGKGDRGPAGRRDAPSCHHHQAGGDALPASHGFQRRALFPFALLYPQDPHHRDGSALPGVRGPGLSGASGGGTGSGRSRDQGGGIPGEGSRRAGEGGRIRGGAAGKLQNVHAALCGSQLFHYRPCKGS